VPNADQQRKNEERFSTPTTIVAPMVGATP
jgi:hypothetical protein